MVEVCFVPIPPLRVVVSPRDAKRDGGAGRDSGILFEGGG